jgi:hypothetical protein
MEFSNKIDKNLLRCDFKFEGIDLTVLKTHSHCIAIFTKPQEIEKGLMKKNFLQIQKKLV